jgi:hypothetical protein
MSQSRGLKHRLKTLMARLLRPGLAPLIEHAATVETRLNNQAMRLQAINVRTDQWSKTLDSLPERLDALEQAIAELAGDEKSKAKYLGELSYWRWLIKTEPGRASLSP